MKSFGDRLRDLREGRDLKQRDVAKDLYISNKVLSSYERNVAFPSLEMFKKICEYYNVSADYLLQIETTAEPEPEADSSRLVALTPRQARLLSYFERLSTENQDAIRGLMVLYYKEQQRNQTQKRNDRAAQANDTGTPQDSDSSKSDAIKKEPVREDAVTLS